MLSCLDDIRSDLSVFHRVDDMESMPARRFWPLVQRLYCYSGAVAATTRQRAAEREPAQAQVLVEQSEPSAASPPIDPMAPVVGTDPESIAALHAHPLYGDIPGLPPVFSHSYAPLAPDPDGGVTDG